MPFTYLDSNEDPVETICYLEVTDSGVSSENELWFELLQFHYLLFDLIGSTCDGNLIPDYQHGMLGETHTAASIYLWTQVNVTDFSEVEEAFEELQVSMLLPPHVSGLSITRGNNVETDPGRISFGDTVTVTIANDAAMAEIAMVFHVPEAYSDEDGVGSEQNVCFYNPISDNNIDQRIFALPSLEGLLIACRAQYDGDWEFDLYAERTFVIFAIDENGNLSPAEVSPLILNPVITVDWSQYPSTIDFPWSDFPVWGTTYDIYKDESAPAFDFNRIKHVSIGVPVTYLDSSAIRVNTMCYVKISSSDIDVNSDNELELDLLSFDDLALDELQGCSDDIPDYQHGMLGETQTALSVYLWTQETVTVLTDVASAFEVLHVNVNLPPEILGHTITRMSNTDLDTQRLYGGDTIHLSFANSQNTSEMFWAVNLPEAFRIGNSPNNNTWCSLWIEPDTNGVFPESVTVPSSSQIYSHCHGENFYPGDWTYDESVSRSIRIFAEDLEGNGIGYPRVDSPLTLAARVQTPEPDPTAPPTTEPTPPKKIIPSEPTPPAPTPEPPAPTPVSTPSVPTPDPIVITPDPIVVTPEPVVTEVLVKSELPVSEKPIKIDLVAKACVKAGVWIFTKNNLLQICDTKLKPVLVIPACTGKKATPTYPWLFKAQRFKPGYSSTQSGQKLYYSVFFFKGLAIAGVDKVSSSPCSNGSVFIEKKYAKQVYTYIAKNKSLIWVKS